MIQEIQSIDVSQISKINFTENGGKKYSISLDSIKKIAIYLSDTYKKTIFGPMELAEVGKIIAKNYKSKLPKEEYNKLLQILGDWVEYGGSFDIIQKDMQESVSNKLSIINFLGLIGRIVIVIFITCIGAGITCGGNLVLYNSGRNLGINDSLWETIWFTEIFLILCISSYYFIWIHAKVPRIAKMGILILILAAFIILLRIFI